MKAIEKEVKKLFDMAVDLPDIGRTHLYEKMEALDKEKKALEAERLKLEKESHDFSAEEITKLLNSYDRRMMNDEAKKKIIKTFVNRVFVYDDKIQIYYSITSSEPVSYSKAISDVKESVRSPATLSHQTTGNTNRTRVIYGAVLCLVVPRP